MEVLFKYASIAWNPIFASRTHLKEGSLRLGKILPAFFAIAIALTFMQLSAQTFFLESIEKFNPAAFPDDLREYRSWLSSGKFFFSGRTAATLLIPVVAAFILPTGLFGQHGKNAVLSASVISLISAKFYQVATESAAFFIGGAGLMSGSNEQLSWIGPLIQIASWRAFYILYAIFFFATLRRVIKLPLWNAVVLVLAMIVIFSATGLLLEEVAPTPDVAHI